MSCKQRRDKTHLFLFIVTCYFYTFQVSHSVSLGQREEDLTAYQLRESLATRWEVIEQDNGAQQARWHLVEEVIQDPSPRKPNPPGLTELRHESATFPGEPLPYFSAATLDETDSNFKFKNSSWTIGRISPEPRSSASDDEGGYQADFAGKSRAGRYGQKCYHDKLFHVSRYR